jgi:D-methionine transport system ATP-binding protein
MIKFSHLSKIFSANQGQVSALNNLSMHIVPGEIVGVIGKSGSGKSTLLRCANLLERPSSGTVEVNGQVLSNLSKKALRSARKQIGMIFQHFNLLSTRSVYQNIALPLKLQGKNKAQIHEVVLSLLDLVDLKDKQSHYPAQLSGGQKQRVAIARALASKPAILLCDEVTSALDPETTLTILDLLKKINLQLGVTILLITHELEVIKHICDRVALLHQGELIEYSDVDNFFSTPKTSIAVEFIQAWKKFGRGCEYVN